MTIGTTPTGRDGRPLVDTQMAAYSLGIRPDSYRRWAGRHHITAAGHRPGRNGGQAVALWDLADIAAALDKRQTLLDEPATAAHDQSQCT